MRCAHCRENVPGTAKELPDRCPHCDSALRDEAGLVLRPVDLDYDSTLALLDEKSRRHTWQGAVLALVLALVGQIFAPAMGGLLAIVQYVWARWLIARSYARYFSPGRRAITRWLHRLALLLVGSLHLAAGLPVVEVIVSPVLFAAVCGTTWAYFRFHLGRERRREPVHVLEKVAVGCLAVALVLLAVTFVLLVWLAVSLKDLLVQWFGG